MNLARRDFLFSAFAATIFPVLPETSTVIRVASNQGAENAALQQLLTDRGYAKALQLDVQLIESRTVSGPMEALLSGAADICMISAFDGVLPAIAQGKPLRLIGAAMLLPELAVYTTREPVTRLEDLPGRTVGIGPLNGLLHILMLALLRKKGVDPDAVKFINIGSNAQVLEAVIAGKVDAGLSGVAGASGSTGPRILDNGRLWLELPEYTYQLSYASVQALRDKPGALASCVAAYTRLYRFLSTPQSKAPYLEARRLAAGDKSVPEGEAVWDYIQRNQPYALEPGLSAQRLAYLQQLNVALGLQSAILPFDQVVDLAPAAAATKLLATASPAMAGKRP